MSKIQSCKDIVGWFDFSYIYDMAVEDSNDGDEFLEIGCFMGKSTAYLMDKIKNSGKQLSVSVIDIFQPECEHHNDLIKANGKSLLEIFDSNMDDLGFAPKKYIGESQELHTQFKDGQFSMIFIDAAHEYESVKQDLNNFWSKVKTGGIYAGHDYGEKTAGVGRAVDEFIKENNLELNISVASWIIIKP